MRRLIPALAGLALLSAGPALAAEGGEGGKAKDPGQNVDLMPVGLPVVVNGRLVNYVFVTIRIQLTPSANAVALRGREPYFRDALVKLGHRTPFTNPADYATLDMPRLQSAFAREAGAIAGPGTVKAVQVVSETPQKKSGLPRPGGAAARSEIRP